MEKRQKVSVGGLLMHEGNALIVRRSEREEQLAGYYELPGGKVEFGDDPARTVEREFKEETGLKARAVKPYYVFSYVHPANTHRIEIVYLVESDERKAVVLSEEHDEYRWIDKTELETLIATGTIRMTQEMRMIIMNGYSEFS